MAVIIAPGAQRSGRGLSRARWAYGFRIGYYWIFRGPVGTQYRVECEIKDLRDEMQRRVKRKNAI